MKQQAQHSQVVPAKAGPGALAGQPNKTSNGRLRQAFSIKPSPSTTAIDCPPPRHKRPRKHAGFKKRTGCLQATVKPLSTVARDGLPETAAAVCSKLPLRVPAPTCQPKAAPGPAPKPRLSQEQVQPESGAEPAVDTAAASMMASGSREPEQAVPSMLCVEVAPFKPKGTPQKLWVDAAPFPLKVAHEPVPQPLRANAPPSPVAITSRAGAKYAQQLQLASALQAEPRATMAAAGGSQTARKAPGVTFLPSCFGPAEPSAQTTLTSRSVGLGELSGNPATMAAAGGSQTARKAPGVTFLPGCFGPAEPSAQTTLTSKSVGLGELSGNPATMAAAGGSQTARKAPGVTFLPGCFGPAEPRAQTTLTSRSVGLGELSGNPATMAAAGGSQAARKAPGVNFLPGCFGPAEPRAQATLTFGSFGPGELGAEDGVTGGGDSAASANANSGNPATEAGGGVDRAAAQPEQVVSAPRENPVNSAFKSTAVDSAPGEVDSCGVGRRIDVVLPSPVADATGLHSVAEHVEVTSATMVAAATEPLTAMQRLCMRASLRRRRVAARKQLPEGRAGFKRATQQQHFRGVMRFLRIRKSLRRHPVTCIRPGKGDVGTRRKINLTTTTGSPAGASAKSTAASCEKATLQHAATGRKLRVRVHVQRQRIKIWVPKGRAGSRHSVPFRVVTRMLRIHKRLQQRPIVCMHLGKGSVGIQCPVHTINLTALASGVPIGEVINATSAAATLSAPSPAQPGQGQEEPSSYSGWLATAAFAAGAVLETTVDMGASFVSRICGEASAPEGAPQEQGPSPAVQRLRGWISTGYYAAGFAVGMAHNPAGVAGAVCRGLSG